MLYKPHFVEAGGHSQEQFASDIPCNAPHSIRFPESFSRTSPVKDDDDPMPDSNNDATPQDDDASVSPPEGSTANMNPTGRISRGSVMRLENILNDVSIEHDMPLRSRSLRTSPVLPEIETLMHSPGPSHTRSESPIEKIVKRKKVKLHRCPECHKDFPRPSGLRTHMNMHTKEKPFACAFPGCSRSFSVVSNAKRHMRTHGMGISIEDTSSETSISIPYVVGFEAPVVIAPPEMDSREPVKLRWVEPPSGSAEASSSRSGAGKADDPTSSADEGDGTDDGDFERESFSGASSRFGGDDDNDDDDDDDDDDRRYVRRRVESDG